MTISYYTASTINGFLATPDDSLDWLFAVTGEGPDPADFDAGVAVYVMGSTTYEWVLNHEDLLAQPEKWQAYFADRPMFVFTTRSLTAPEGADVRFVSGPVADALPAIQAAAGGGTIWVEGGGDLVGQFLDIDALDEIVVNVAPTFLAAGRPLLPRDVYPDRLTLTKVEHIGQFAVLHYAVTRPAP